MLLKKTREIIPPGIKKFQKIQKQTQLKDEC